MGKSKRATVYDVARHAGVSYQTVSRVINGNPNVSEKTLRRVQAAIQELNFLPNKAAQMLVTRRSFTLGLIMLGTDYYGPAQMMSGVERAARKFGYKLIYVNIEHDQPEQHAELINALDMVDGLITIDPLRDSQIDSLLQASNKPFVKIGTAQGIDVPSVIIDQWHGSQMAVQHLLSLGHRRIAEISGPLHWHDAFTRHESWRNTLEAQQFDTTLSVQGDWTAQGGYQAARTLWDRPFTGLIVGNDQMAIGAMHALYENHVRIPEDVAIVGFDDIPESAYLAPPLTTVRQDFHALGIQSVEYLIQILGDPQTPRQQRILLSELVVRRSTARTL
jgi:LacI family transcriptional regulator